MRNLWVVGEVGLEDMFNGFRIRCKNSSGSTQGQNYCAGRLAEEAGEVLMQITPVALDFWQCAHKWPRFGSGCVALEPSVAP